MLLFSLFVYTVLLSLRLLLSYKTQTIHDTFNTDSQNESKIQSNGFDTCCYKMLQLAAEMTNKQFQSVFISWQSSSMSLLNFLQFHQ